MRQIQGINPLGLDARNHHRISQNWNLLVVLRLGGSSCGVRVGLPVESDGEVEITFLGDMLLVGAAELILGEKDGRMEGMVLGATESVGTLDGNVAEGLILGEAEGKIVGVAD
eukprot:scaffold22706_cov193-Cylindrotheca_fusiformis.AAC.1